MVAIFRVDASIQIGTGHVMRCLTLANELKRHGIESEFISRAHPGNLINFIETQGFPVHVLAHNHAGSSNLAILNETTGSVAPAHYQWLGATLEEDYGASLSAVSGKVVDWLIVDHYALDAHWESKLRPYCEKIMVIDDLADRRHECDLLLDQTYGRSDQDYLNLVPGHARILCGSHYALLRPEFNQLRTESLKRREQNSLREILISMGGVDKDNVTGQILQLLALFALPEDCRITIVMGKTAPWLEQVRMMADKVQLATRVLVGVENMAQLMADSDLAIGAAGATTWERCCLGLPSVILILAENQRSAALTLDKDGIVKLVDVGDSFTSNFCRLLAELFQSTTTLASLTIQSMKIVDGKGSSRVVSAMLSSGAK